MQSRDAVLLKKLTEDQWTVVLRFPRAELLSEVGRIYRDHAAAYGLYTLQIGNRTRNNIDTFERAKAIAEQWVHDSVIIRFDIKSVGSAETANEDKASSGVADALGELLKILNELFNCRRHRRFPTERHWLRMQTSYTEGVNALARVNYRNIPSADPGLFGIDSYE